MKYDFNYFEAGVEHGVSGYQNYRWIPEISFPIAHNLIVRNNLIASSKIIDYGCAKGFLLKAFKLLGLPNIYGADISSYAVENADPTVKSLITLIDPAVPLEYYYKSDFDLIVFKDVLEHIYSEEVMKILESAYKISKRIFIAVPLGVDDTSGRFVIPAMHNDVTHVNIKSKTYWEKVVTSTGWEIASSEFTYPGIKSNWVAKYPLGNLFITATH